MLLFLLLGYASATCYTDEINLQDPDYTYVVGVRLNKERHYVIHPNPSFERLVIGSGETLDHTGTVDHEGAVELYDFEKGASTATMYRFQEDPSSESAPSIDITQSFELIIRGPIVQLIQHGDVVIELPNYFRIPFQIGWYNGSICIESFELEKPEKPVKHFMNYITPFEV